MLRQSWDPGTQATLGSICETRETTETVRDTIRQLQGEEGECAQVRAVGIRLIKRPIQKKKLQEINKVLDKHKRKPQEIMWLSP